MDARLGQVQADERKIRQVLLNLLSNAIKFTPEGGRIEVRATLADGSVEISVSDTGVGIAPEDQEAVFEEFRQVGAAAEKQEGTGLGLALCRKFVELHGGTIWVRSAVGAGSTFAFRYPCSQDQATARQPCDRLGPTPLMAPATSASARSLGARAGAIRRASTSPPRRRCTARWAWRTGWSRRRRSRWG